MEDLNLQPSLCKRAALPIELIGQMETIGGRTDDLLVASEMLFRLS